MSTQTSPSDTMLEAKPGAAKPMPMGGVSSHSGGGGGGGGPMLAAVGIGALIVGGLIGVGIMSGRPKPVETELAGAKLMIAPQQDQALSQIRDSFQKLEADKRAATDALAGALRLDQVPVRFRASTPAATVVNLVNADADLARFTAATPATVLGGTPTAKPIGGAPTPGVTPVGTEPALTAVVAELDAAIAKNPLWLTAFKGFGENPAFDQNSRKLARVMHAIGAIDDPNRITLPQLQNAVKAVQRDAKLKEDAVVGPRTWAAIKRLVTDKKG